MEQGGFTMQEVLSMHIASFQPLLDLLVETTAALS